MLRVAKVALLAIALGAAVIGVPIPVRMPQRRDHAIVQVVTDGPGGDELGRILPVQGP